MFRFLKRQDNQLDVDRLIGILTDKPVTSAAELFERYAAAESLAKLGSSASRAMPALLKTLVVPVSVDSHLCLRVAVAEALWKVGGRRDLALPFLGWALKDEYWGVSHKAVQVLDEMGQEADQAVPDLLELADRRCSKGPFPFESFPISESSSQRMFLADVATALGHCGRGGPHSRDVHCMLTRISAHNEEDARTAALRALEGFG